MVTWWQPETGAIVIAPLPGLTAAKPGSPMSSLPGISAHIVDDDTDLVALGERGNLVLDRPWPSMARGIWGDDELFVETYWRRFAERCWCFTGVEARYDDDDAIWLLGRDDAVMIVPVALLGPPRSTQRFPRRFGAPAQCHDTGAGERTAHANHDDPDEPTNWLQTAAIQLTAVPQEEDGDERRSTDLSGIVYPYAG